MASPAKTGARMLLLAILIVYLWVLSSAVSAPTLRGTPAADQPERPDPPRGSREERAPRTAKTSRGTRCAPRAELKAELQHQYSGAEVEGIMQHIKKTLDELTNHQRRNTHSRSRISQSPPPKLLFH